MTVNNNIRSVIISCIECGSELEFHIENNVVVEGHGIIACNIPAAVCSDCVESLLSRVADPPGLICINGLSPALARMLLESFTFLLPKSDAIKFFGGLFSEIGLTGKLK